MRVRLGHIGATVTLAAIGVLAWSGPAAAEIVRPAGACTASATWSAGGFAKTTAQLKPSDVVEVPRADTVSWSGRVVGPAAGAPRQAAGRVALKLPPPLGAITLVEWDGSTSDIERSGTYAYKLPSVVPSGVVLDLTTVHDEAGRRHCTAEVGVVIPGGPFDTPLTWVALAGLALLTGGLALLGRGRPGPGRIAAAALVGLPFGVFLALTLVLFGVLPLASVLVTLLPILGLGLGALWTWWSPLAPRTPAGG